MVLVALAVLTFTVLGLAAVGAGSLVSTFGDRRARARRPRTMRRRTRLF